MSIVGADADGIRQIADVLKAGRPVVLPLPSPLPYVVAGRDAARVNRVKGRPADQPTGMLVSDLAVVEPYLALDADTIGFVRALSAAEQVNLFLPVTGGVPAWMGPSTSDGLFAVTLTCLDCLRCLAEETGYLYLSSANRTGEAVAVTAATANAAFDDALPVLDGDALRDSTTPSGSATIVRIGPHRRVEVARRGIQDAGAGSGEEYLREVINQIEA